MPKRVAAFFCMKLVGHFRRTLPLLSRLSRTDVRVVAFTHASFRREVEAAGAEFFDMLGRFPLEGVDEETSPRSARYVTYAARYAEDVAAEVARLGASLVLSDTFAVIGRVAAQALGLPHVNLCAGHAPDPLAIEDELRRGGFVRLSPRCLDGVRQLRETFGIEDAHPFMYISHQSPYLNVYGEPRQFLDPDRRSCPPPAEFFGSIPDDWASRGAAGDPCFAVDLGTKLRVCVSFGTMIWNFYAAEAQAGLRVIRDTVGRLPWAQAVIGLGGAEQGGAAVTGGGKNVSLRPWLDPWRALRDADVLVTHHGLNSTHEAILHRVPMLSYPFLWDQPALAKRCQELGLALPLAAAPREPLTARGVRRALEVLAETRGALLPGLEKARGWELDVMARRDAVVRRILGLVEAS